MQDFTDQSTHQTFPQYYPQMGPQTGPLTGAQPPRRANPIWWVLGCGGLLVVSLCVVCGAGLVFVGVRSPETHVYTGNQVPARFIQTAKNVGALEDDEKILFFYSDAMMEITEGFYFVSDKRVVIYSTAAGDSPLLSAPFHEIADVQLSRNESFFEDSEITLELNNGEFVSFPVSSEYDKDQAFFEAIQSRVRPGVGE